MTANISEEVTLRPLETTDNTQIALLANNIKIWNNVRDMMPYPYSLNDADEFIGFCMNEEPTTTFAIVYKSELTGLIGLTLQRDVYRLTAEVGYWLGETYWNKGITSKALKLIVEYGFAKFDLIKIYAGVFEYNKASQRVLEKTGFNLEGVLKKSVIKNDIICDEYRYGLLKE
jgi:RimJ/RimL family protein N-acetyltransferase